MHSVLINQAASIRLINYDLVWQLVLFSRGWNVDAR